MVSETDSPLVRTHPQMVDNFGVLTRGDYLMKKLDVLELGNEACMNLPASQMGNWAWRFKAELLTEEIAGRLKQLTAVYGRLV